MITILLSFISKLNASRSKLTPSFYYSTEQRAYRDTAVERSISATIHRGF